MCHLNLCTVSYCPSEDQIIVFKWRKLNFECASSRQYHILRSQKGEGAVIWGGTIFWGYSEFIHVYMLSFIAERPIHFLEKVLDVTLRWTEWPEEFCRDNYLVVKENYVYENVDNVVRSFNEFESYGSNRKCRGIRWTHNLLCWSNWRSSALWWYFKAENDCFDQCGQWKLYQLSE